MRAPCWAGLAAGLLLGCGGGTSGPSPAPPPPPPPPPAPPAVASVTVTPPAVATFVGDTVRLTAAVRDAQGNLLSRTVAWTSANAVIASVSTSGLVTGLTAGGPIQVSATTGGVTGSAAVTVQPPLPIATLELERATATMALRQTLTLAVTARAAGGQLLPNRTMQWTSSDPAVGSVGADGVITANHTGVFTLTASAEGHSVSATVTVIAFTDIATGFAETCAVSEAGKLYCAGIRQGNRARLVAPALRFVNVFTGKRLHDIGCALATDQALYCWGENSAGELGVGDSVSRDTPTLVAGNLAFKSVTMGQGIRGGLIINGVPIPAEVANHTCGLTTGNDLYCWGDGKSGGFGTGALVSSPVPVVAAPGKKYTDVTVGRMYTCGIDESGVTWCWGDNDSGHLGRGAWSTTVSPTPAGLAVPLTLHGLTGGGATCGLDPGGAAYCWGDNTLHKLGYVSTETCFGGKLCSTTPTAVATAVRFTALASSQYSTCGLDQAGTVYCWGMNIDDKFGTTLPAGCVTPNSQAPCTAVPTAGPSGFATLSAGAYTHCGIKFDGGAYCWGGNRSGQLGYPGVSTSMQPVVFSLDPAASP